MDRRYLTVFPVQQTGCLAQGLVPILITLIGRPTFPSAPITNPNNFITQMHRQRQLYYKTKTKTQTLLTSNPDLRGRRHISRAQQVKQSRRLRIIRALHRVTALGTTRRALGNRDRRWCRWHRGDGWTAGTRSWTRKPGRVAPAVVGDGGFGREGYGEGEEQVGELHGYVRLEK